ncbi:hypothetical protein DFH29DRAFT_1066648 [Suillus ampliporus]|nr:hypothetical protein DFH29DRAFT_1066648 [Suillus ampliporus]
MLQKIKVVCIGQGTLSSTDMNVVPISSSPTEGSVQPIPSPWTTSKADVDLVIQKLNSHTFADTLPSLDQLYAHEHPFVKIAAFGPDLYHDDEEGKPIGTSVRSTLSDGYFDWDFEKWGGLSEGRLRTAIPLLTPVGIQMNTTVLRGQLTAADYRLLPMENESNGLLLGAHFDKVLNGFVTVVKACRVDGLKLAGGGSLSLDLRHGIVASAPGSRIVASKEWRLRVNRLRRDQAPDTSPAPSSNFCFDAGLLAAPWVPTTIAFWLGTPSDACRSMGFVS